MTIPRIAALGLALILTGLSLAWGIGAWQQGRAGKAGGQEAVASGEAAAHETQARATEPVVADLTAKLEASTTRENRLLRERDVLLRRVAAMQRDGYGTGHGPGDQGAVPTPDSAVDSYAPTREDVAALVAVIEKDAETIEALQESGRVKDALIVSLTKRADEWQAAAEARDRENKGLRVALSARPPVRNWSLGARVETLFDGRKALGATARRDLGVGYVEVSGFADRAGFGFGWRF